MVSETMGAVRMMPTHPGTFIRDEIIDPLNLSITRAAEVLGVRRATLSDLMREKTSLSPEMALRMEKAFGVSMDTLLRMQAWFDTCAMRARSAEFSVARFTPSPPSRK